jgi:hypothetical protein
VKAKIGVVIPVKVEPRVEKATFVERRLAGLLDNGDVMGNALALEMRAQVWDELREVVGPIPVWNQDDQLGRSGTWLL